MALAAVQVGMNLEGKGLHPFFSKTTNDQRTDPTPPANGTPVVGPQHESGNEHANTSPQPGKVPKKRRRKAPSMTGEKITGFMAKTQSSLEQFRRPPKIHDTVGAEGNHDTLTPNDDTDNDRRKRRKTASPAPTTEPSASLQPPVALTNGHQLQANMEQSLAEDKSSVLLSESVSVQNGGIGEHVLENHQEAPQAASIVTPNSEVMIIASDPSLEESKKAAPTKQIKITKSGKLLSSPPKPVAEPAVSPKKKRGRKSAKPVTYHLVTIIKYGTDAASRLAIAQKIDRILNGEKVIELPRNPKRKSPKPAGPPKVTHPFFTGKPGPKKDPSGTELVTTQRPPTPRKSAVTPGKLRSEAWRDRSPEPRLAFGMASSATRATKQSGLNEAPWPTKATAHVRNEDYPNQAQHPLNQKSRNFEPRCRKLKNNVINLSDKENIISRLARDLKHSRDPASNMAKGDFELPKDVRLPTRLLTTGDDIQRRVSGRLKTILPNSSKVVAHQNAHPAILKIFNEIENTLTPFDTGKCENLDWTHKYSPQKTEHVLQTGPEAMVLKDWLQSLEVMAVGGVLKSSSMTDIKNPPRKKRKKAVDAFIVSDDEEEEDEEMIQLNSQSTSFRRPNWTRNKNVVLISGPHGCGKSATVYAVAKEMGFEVFEINSGVRRSGKDIQDKVGDMTANHLVNHDRSTSITKDDVVVASDTETERMDNALRKDLDSGRQGTVTSFFQTQGPAIPKRAKMKATEPQKAPTSIAQAMLPLLKATRKSQKQSLILFEEADILYEEDQQFWAQVLKLASQSKRPIVITCNDEQQIPVDALPLAAILRLQPPPVDLATDYLLTLVGREGHILEREAVSDLYRSKKNDLRASIMELNFWCQMSVGDRKGGLEWMYQRWPPCRDINESGRPLRVASEGTYYSGMGWLSHNIFETTENTVLDKEEELLKQVWTDWSISPTAWKNSAMTISKPNVVDDTTVEKLRILQCLDAYSASRSDADFYCRVGLPSYDEIYHEPTDPTQPLLTDKARLNYTLAARVLQVDHHSDFMNLGCNMSMQTDLLIRRAFPEFSQVSPEALSSMSDSSEEAYAKAILAHNDRQSETLALDRLDFAVAFDALDLPPDSNLSYNLAPSSFDRTFSIITLDLAPYVRSMVAHEQVLEAQRLRLSNLLSAGGTGKRSRTTRASRTALEGGMRETKRRDRWFDQGLNFELVMRTAGKTWAGMGWKGEGVDGDGVEGTASVTGTQDSANGDRTTAMQE